MADQLPPVNRQPPPWARTFTMEGNSLLHPVHHAAVQHPNVLHMERDAASPFDDSAHIANGLAGRARHAPPFSSPGLHVGPRK